MPQLAPINWLLLFILFWITVATVAVIIWWSYKPNYSINTPVPTSTNTDNNSWPW
nr:ATPase 8 [Haliotis madaka]BCT24181.1 ATPase 8 [Haliotis gigantea]BCT24219.1 ATPase 8 [Haliotis discus]BCT24182.1 ATPase 8 [Haliotis gigantea]BCT24183.1 ATPase 8 [Haliotis gigantea]